HSEPYRPRARPPCRPDVPYLRSNGLPATPPAPDRSERSARAQPAAPRDPALLSARREPAPADREPRWTPGPPADVGRLRACAHADEQGHQHPYFPRHRRPLPESHSRARHSATPRKTPYPALEPSPARTPSAARTPTAAGPPAARAQDRK